VVFKNQTRMHSVSFCLIEICLSLKLLLDLTRLLSDLADMRKALLIDKDKESIKLPKGIKSGRDWGVGPEEIVF